jgi:hypothetical protein
VRQRYRYLSEIFCKITVGYFTLKTYTPVVSPVTVVFIDVGETIVQAAPLVLVHSYDIVIDVDAVGCCWLEP